MKDQNKISVFRNYAGIFPVKDISIIDFCNTITGTDYKQAIEKIRTIEDKEERDAEKFKLPAFTVSGTFSERRAINLIKHSGFIAIDLDPKDNPGVTDWPELRDNLARIPNVFFSALSASGSGVFALIPIAYPDKHKEHWYALNRYFWAEYKLKLDPKCKDVSRLRGISYDPDAKMSMESVPYRLTYTPPPQKPLPARYNFDDGDFDKLIEKIIDSGIDITSDYGDWLKIGWALVNEKGEGGRSLYHQISKFYLGYTEKGCDKQYDACLRNSGQPTKNFLFSLCKDYGILIAGEKRGASASAPRPGSHIKN